MEDGSWLTKTWPLTSRARPVTCSSRSRWFPSFDEFPDPDIARIEWAIACLPKSTRDVFLMHASPIFDTTASRIGSASPKSLSSGKLSGRCALFTTRRKARCQMSSCALTPRNNRSPSIGAPLLQHHAYKPHAAIAVQIVARMVDELPLRRVRQIAAGISAGGACRYRIRDQA